MNRNSFVKDQAKHALIQKYKDMGYKTSLSRIYAAIETAKNADLEKLGAAAAQPILDIIAQHYRIQGLTLLSSWQITGYTATKEATI